MYCIATQYQAFLNNFIFPNLNCVRNLWRAMQDDFTVKLQRPLYWFTKVNKRIVARY